MQPVGAVAVTERESADQAHHEAEGGVEKREEGTGDRPQRQRDCAALSVCDKPHRPTHRHHQYVSQPQVHHPPDDACQRPQDTKDIHGLYQTLLRGDSRRNRRHVQERE